MVFATLELLVCVKQDSTNKLLRISLDRKTTSMAGYYSRDADLRGHLRKVVEFIDHESFDHEYKPGSKVSNKRIESI